MSGRIPQQFIDELTTRVDIVDVIDGFVPLRKTGRDYVARCPFHDEKSPSFTVSQEKQFYHCFGCGAHGTAIGFLMEYNHMPFVEAVEELASRVGMQVPRETGALAKPDEGLSALYAILDQAARWFRQQLRRGQGQVAIDYLKERGLSGEIAAEYGLGYAPATWDGLITALTAEGAQEAQLATAGLVLPREKGGHYDRFRERVMFPIRDQRGRVVGFGGRVLGDGTPKYLNSPETPVFHKGRELYGLYETRQAVRKLERLIVVEGYMDVLMLAQHGIRYAVATLGTATTTQHVERMLRLVPEVVFCFDGDRAGREAAWRALENTLPQMREGLQARFLFLPEGEDPDTLIRKEKQEAFERRIVTAVPLSQFFYDSLQRRADTSSIDGRARLVELARPYLSKVPVGVFRYMMEERLAELARIDAGTLKALLAGKGPNGGGIRGRAGERTAARRGSRQGPKGRTAPSLVRRAIALLLHQPRLAAQAEDIRRLAGLDLPGVALLIEIVELLRANPHLTTGALLEHWRGEENGRILAKLLQQTADMNMEDSDREFGDALWSLRCKYVEQQIDELNRKSRTIWSPEEKIRLQQLLDEKIKLKQQLKTLSSVL